MATKKAVSRKGLTGTELKEIAGQLDAVHLALGTAVIAVTESGLLLKKDRATAGACRMMIDGQMKELQRLHRKLSASLKALET